jgi:hypothetical protein
MIWERIDDNPPGLLSRAFYTEDGAEYVREEWDLTVPGCPMIAIDATKWGTGEPVIDLTVKGLTRIKRLSSPPSKKEGKL